MRRTSVEDKDEKFLFDNKEEEICLRLDEVEKSARIHEEGIRTTQDKVDKLNDQVQYLTGLTEHEDPHKDPHESTFEFVDKVFIAQQ